jgi:hypothetical protein
VLLKLDNRLIHGQAVTGLGQDFGYYTIAFGVQYVLHLHRFDEASISPAAIS